MLRGIESRYPGGLRWLDIRYDDILFRRAFGLGIFADGVLVGLAISSPKGVRKAKLSTIMVAADWRGRGVGQALLNRILRVWDCKSVEEGWVTVDAADETTARFLAAGGFELAACIGQRYREDAKENVLIWTPDALQKSTLVIH